MYTPDRVILRKIREYDPYLFVEWNGRKQWFDLWRHMPHGRRLITPITQSIYEAKAPRKFTPLDERILWWLYDADSWRSGGSKAHAREADSRWLEFLKKKDKNLRKSIYDLAKDIWQGANAFYTTRHASKNSGKPTWNKNRPTSRWIAPDSQSRSARRVFARTAQNARRAFGR